jgi:rare lipoprotein A
MLRPFKRITFLSCLYLPVVCALNKKIIFLKSLRKVQHSAIKIPTVLCYLSLVIFALLNGCSTARRDGPPSYNVDVSKIPNAIPRIEPLSRIGNKPYTVFGKKYYVLSSSRNYEEHGIASWYGTKFDGRHTSNGERYNMLAMTAAHKTLPLPTYVEVTNLKNGRKVIVKVTDRGPFEASRLIDLSYAAAKKLGMLGHGTAIVNVRAITPVDNSIFTNHFFLAKNFKKNRLEAKIDNKFVNHSVVYLQVGVFHNKLNAEKLKKRLVLLIESPVYIRLLAHNNKLYRVQIGPLQDAVTIAQINRQLRAIGIKSKETLG